MHLEADHAVASGGSDVVGEPVDDALPQAADQRGVYHREHGAVARALADEHAIQGRGDGEAAPPGGHDRVLPAASQRHAV